jgi:ribosomal protein L40E
MVNMPTCSKCGNKLLPRAKFCAICGQKVARVKRSKKASKRSPTRKRTPKIQKSYLINWCENCGARLLPGAEFCVRCGAKVVVDQGARLTYLAAFLGGIVAIIPAAVVESLFSVGISSMSALALAAGFVEEPMKQIGVARKAFRAPSGIPSRKSGLIAGALAGIGFGIIESILYVTILSSIIPLPEAIGVRTMTVLLHAGMSAIAGMGIFYATTSRERSMPKFFLLLLVAIALHSSWDYAAVRIG